MHIVIRVINSKECPLFHPSTKSKPLRGFFMTSSAVTTSVDAIWRSRERCYCCIREGTRHQGSIKKHYSISLKLLNNAWDQTRKVGILGWRIIRVKKKKRRKTRGGETEQKHVPSWLTITHSNLAFMMTFSVTFIHINLLVPFISLK